MKKSGVGKEKWFWAYTEQPAASKGVLFSECVCGRWKEAGKTGLDLRVAGNLDKKFWESQELREDERQPAY